MQKMSNDDIARAAVEIVEARVRAAADAEHAFEAMMSVVRPRLSRDAWRRGVLANAGVSEEQIASLRGEWALTPGLFEDSARYRHDVARMIEGTAGGYWGGPGPTLPRTPTSNVERVAIETARVGHSPWSVIMLALDDLRDDVFGAAGSIERHEQQGAAVRDQRDRAVRRPDARPAGDRGRESGRAAQDPRRDPERRLRARMEGRGGPGTRRLERRPGGCLEAPDRGRPAPGAGRGRSRARLKSCNALCKTWLTVFPGAC